MDYYIQEINGKFYVFGMDERGNIYDTMRHFITEIDARAFVFALKLKDENNRPVPGCDQHRPRD